MAGPQPIWPREEKNQQCWAESAWPSNITSGGNYFPPPLLHAERCSFCMQGKTTKAQQLGGEKLPGVEEVVRCWSGCFAGGAAVEAGGDVVAHRRRLQAAMLLFKRRRERFLPLPLSSGFFVFSFFVSFTHGCC